MKKFNKTICALGTVALTVLLSGCKYDLLNPAGYVAEQERTLIFICVGVMLCVVIPVMIAVVLFAIKYRASRESEQYLPDWGHSNKIEAFMWSIPIIIVAILGILTAIYTFKLEPSRDLPAGVSDSKPVLQVDAVALDWKWLFIYPQYGVASINELYAPVRRQVFLQLSSENSVNAFWVPRLGTILYAMPQMNAKIHLVAQEKGIFNGISANFSGDGFSDMKFKWHSVDESQFNDWINKLRSNHATLTRESYMSLAKAPAAEDIAAKVEDTKVRYFGKVDKELYYRIVNGCVPSNKECNERLMWRDAASSLWGQLCSVFNADYVQK